MLISTLFLNHKNTAINAYGFHDLESYVYSKRRDLDNDTTHMIAVIIAAEHVYIGGACSSMPRYLRHAFYVYWVPLVSMDAGQQSHSYFQRVKIYFNLIVLVV